MASYITRTLNANRGLLPSAMGGGPNVTDSVNAVLGLAAMGAGRQAVARTMSAVRAQVPTFARKDGAPVPAALGLLLMAAHATGANPRDFGGMNLVTTLQGSERR